MKRLNRYYQSIYCGPGGGIGGACPEGGGQCRTSIASKDNKVPVYQAGKAQKWTLRYPIIPARIWEM